jgi:hypothetical protein
MATATSSQGENRKCTAKPTMMRATMVRPAASRMLEIARLLPR